MVKIMKLKIKVLDYCIIGLIVIFGSTGLWFNLQSASASDYRYATVYVENRQVAELSLSNSDHFSYTFNFGDDNEHTATLEVDSGRIRMIPLEEELCPKGICAHTGWISYSYESIVCLPNQILIIFDDTTAGRSEDEIDGITF